MSDRPPLDDALVLYATRYALGQPRYAVGEVTDYLLAYWDNLAPKTQFVIRTDIAHAIKLDRPWTVADRKAWERVLERARQTP